MPSTAMMPATPAAPAIGMSATAGTTVQTTRMTVTVGSSARPLAKAGLMQQRCFCNISAPAKAVPLQQRGTYNSRATGTVGHHQKACNSKNDSSNRRMPVTVGSLARPPTRAGLL